MGNYIHKHVVFTSYDILYLSKAINKAPEFNLRMFPYSSIDDNVFTSAIICKLGKEGRSVFTEFDDNVCRFLDWVDTEINGSVILINYTEVDLETTNDTPRIKRSSK